MYAFAKIDNGLLAEYEWNDDGNIEIRSIIRIRIIIIYFI